MRNSYNTKSTIHFSVSVLTALGALAFATPGFAQDAGTDSGAGGSSGGTPVQPCDPTTLECSRGAFPQKAESMDRLPGQIDSGWLPKCSSNGPHCDKMIQARAQIAFDPIKGGGPIYIVDMTKHTFIDARWDPSSPDKFVLSLPPAGSTDGKFTVAHTMTPEIGLYVNTSVYKGELHYDASALINKLPGAKFNYSVSNAASFAPWGFDSVKLNVASTDLDNSQLFSVSFHDLGKMFGTDFSDYVEGKFGFNAVSDTDFVYQTTQVVIDAPDGKKVLGDTSSTVDFPMQDTDELSFNASTKGIIRYDGKIKLKFVISITSIAKTSVNLNYPINAYTVPYGHNNVPVTFQSTTVKIPLPNVTLDTNTMQFGTVETGTSSDKQKRLIENTGKMAAKVQFISSDPGQFKVVETATQIEPGDTYELKVYFRPLKPGVQKGTITVKSNDPDTPEMKFNVVGKGVGEEIDNPDEDAGAGGSGGSPAEKADTAGGLEDDSGCGCRTAGSAGSNGTGAMLALLGLGLAAIRRRKH